MASSILLRELARPVAPERHSVASTGDVTVRWTPQTADDSRPASNYLRASGLLARFAQLVRELPKNFFLYVFRA